VRTRDRPAPPAAAFPDRGALLDAVYKHKISREYRARVVVFRTSP
jgi:hypothetical protein